MDETPIRYNIPSPSAVGEQQQQQQRHDIENGGHAGENRGPGLHRMKSLVRPERSRSRRYKPMVTDEKHHQNANFTRDHGRTTAPVEEQHEDGNSRFNPWQCFVVASTCCCFPCCLKKCGIHEKPMQQAWREKVVCTFCFSLSVKCCGHALVTSANTKHNI